MTRVQKSYPTASFKALPGEGEGTFEAVVSVFGNVDLQGDRVMPGAFEKSIAKWRKSGDLVPVLWSHSWADPFAHIGYVDPQDMKEVPANQKAGFGGGLYVKGHLDVHKPFAKQVYDLLAERRVTEHSFSYDIPPGGEMRGKDGANELHTVDLIELGPTLKGANPATMTLGTKSDEPSDEEERRMKLRLDRAHDDELRLQLEKFDPSQERDAVGQWTAGSAPKPSDGPGHGGADSSQKWPKGHPLGEGTLNELRTALTHAGMSKDDATKLAQSMREHFDRTGKIDIPPEADKFLPEHQRAQLGESIRTEAQKRGWKDPEKSRRDDAELRIAIEKASWNGDAAMGSCHSAADYRKIAFERANDSDPDTAAHWALPHHSSPGADANPAGVSAALGALNGARGGAPDLKNKAAAESHLQAHAGASKAEEPELPEKVAEPDGEKTGRVVGEKAAAALKDKLSGAIDAWVSDMNGTADGGDMMKAAGFDPSLHPRDDQGQFASTPGGGGGSMLPGTSITADDARKAAAAARAGTEGQDYGGADARVVVGPDGSVIDGSTDHYWAKEAWRSAPEGSVLVEPDGTVIEGNGTTHPPKKSEPEPGGKKDFAKGYADGTTGRAPLGEGAVTGEYLRGYEDGQKERAAVENQEIAQFNEIISGLKTT